MAETTAVLWIGRYDTQCGNCRGSVDYRATHCREVFGHHPRRGCGARFTHVAATYLGMAEEVHSMRPDLKVLRSVLES